MVRKLDNYLLEGISRLDISHTMFKEATEHYMAIANLLEKNGVDADFYPQGSFSTGTVVRPYDPADEDAYYDLDMVCLVKDRTRESSSPAELMERVKDAILGDGTYKDKCTVYPECITIKYARSESRPGFNLDIVVAVSPSGVDRLVYALMGVDTRWAEQDLSIAKTWPPEWMGSNPHALCDWFKEKNEPFSAFCREARLRSVVESNASVYASIEEVPESMDRSALQRAIQVAKRARDIYYSHREDGVKVPESCMLLVMIARHAETMPASSSPTEILQSFCSANRAIKPLVDIRADCEMVRSGKLVVINPVFPENFLEGWTAADMAALFAWLKILEEDLAVEWDDASKRSASLRRILGDGGLPRVAAVAPFAPTVANVASVKPWGSKR